MDECPSHQVSIGGSRFLRDSVSRSPRQHLGSGSTDLCGSLSCASQDSALIMMCSRKRVTTSACASVVIPISVCRQLVNGLKRAHQDSCMRASSWTIFILMDAARCRPIVLDSRNFCVAGAKLYRDSQLELGQSLFWEQRHLLSYIGAKDQRAFRKQQAKRGALSRVCGEWGLPDT